MFEKALQLAYDSHKGQLRKKTGVPYIIHPLKVVERISLWGSNDIELWTIAILHDVVEDCKNVTVEQLVTEFTYNIAASVSALTKREQEDGESKQEYKRYKEDYLENICKGGLNAFVVKLADRYCNLKDFWDVGDDYYVKYYRKSRPLIEAASDRYNDIASLYTERFAKNIIRDFYNLKGY